MSDTGWVHPIRAFDEWGITAEQFWINLLTMHRDHEHDVLCMMGKYVFGWNIEDAEKA